MPCLRFNLVQSFQVDSTSTTPADIAPYKPQARLAVVIFNAVAKMLLFNAKPLNKKKKRGHLKMKNEMEKVMLESGDQFVSSTITGLNATIKLLKPEKAAGLNNIMT